MRSHDARQLLKGRRSTLSSSNPLTVVVSSHPEHPEIPTIVATTEAYQESQESNAAPLPDKYVMSSSPSSLSVLSVPSIPEPPPWPGHDHTSQPEQLKIETPLQHHSSNIAHSRSEGVLRTNSSVSLHRPPLKHRFSEPLSSSCSRLEFPSRRHVHSPQSYYMNHAHPNGNGMIHPRPIHHSVSQEYYHQPLKCGYGHQLICKLPFHSDGSPSCSLKDYFISPEASQTGPFEADLSPPTVACNCVENLCPHCGLVRGVSTSVPHHQPAMMYLPAVPYPTHQVELSMMTVTSSNDTRRTKTGPTASKGRGAKQKLNTYHLPSATASTEQPIGNQNPTESESESDHCSSTNDDDQELQNFHTKDKEVSSGSVKPSESADYESKNRQVTKQRPHSATAGTGHTVAITSDKHNLHASADTLAEDHGKHNIIIIIGMLSIIITHEGEP